MKKLLLLSFIALATLIPQVYSISLKEYIERNGVPHIEDFYLDLSNKNLTDITGLQDIPHINEITLLALSDNQLQTLPDDIFNSLPNLICLYLNNNRLKDLPPTLFSSLHNLEALDLSNNYLQIVPNTIFSNLDKLQNLNLTGNFFNVDFIPAITEIIQNIPQLKNLNGRPKSEAISNVPFATLKQMAAKLIINNINNYNRRLRELPKDLKDEITSSNKNWCSIV